MANFEEIKSNNPVLSKLQFMESRQDLLRVLNGAYIAERFFGKSGSWLCHKINNDMVNGKREGFTPAERKKLKDALDTIAYEIQNLSDNL